MNVSSLRHLACIADGNRRWAKAKGWFAGQGHREGIVAAQRVIDFCIKNNISFLTLYIFSTENAKRPPQELEYLFSILAKEAYAELDKFVNKGICIRFIGDRTLFPASLMPVIQGVEEKTKDLKNLTLNLLFFYGGKQEIVHSFQQILKAIQSGVLTEKDLSPDLIEKYLWMHDTPSPDLIIRTGGQHRLSNFLLYQAAYAELYFLDCLWPDINQEHLEQAVQFFNQCQRNFGT